MHQLAVAEDKELLGALTRDKNAVLKNGVLCASFEREKDYIIFKEKLVERIAYIIETKYAAESVKRSRAYSDKRHNAKEKDEILTAAENVMAKKRDSVIEKLWDYFDENNKISPKGFYDFRLAGYKKEILEKAEEAAENIRTRKEYEEFTAILREFVKSRAPLCGKMEIAVTAGGGYMIFDGKYNDITARCVGEAAQVYGSGEINFDEILLCTLITYVPEKIVFHNRKYIKTPNLYETLESIFESRIECCGGCEICKKI